ncbi:MAG: NOP5/NOP56 family protein [Candidatus Hydrothermarchaeota archaeon]
MEDIYLLQTPFGVFLLNEKRMILDKVIFKENHAEKWMKIKKGEIIPELEELIKKNRVSKLILEDKRLSENLGIKTKVEFPCEVIRKKRDEMSKLAIEEGFVKNEKDFQSFINKIALETSKLEIKDIIGEEDKLIINAIRTLDDLDQGINILVQRLREWYSLHFPELDKEIEDHSKYVSYVKLGDREEIGKLDENLEKIQTSSMGVELREYDIEIIKRLATCLDELYRYREELLEYIETFMSSFAPNLSKLAGPVLGAKLIALSNGLKELASLPASTIQVLGAEKALFRHLRKGTKPPKHGIIFQHPIVHKAPAWQRGKISRTFSSKIALCARIDAYSGEDKSEEILEDLKARIEHIKKKYPKPKKRIR